MSIKEFVQAYERMFNDVLPDGLLYRFKTRRDHRNDRFRDCLKWMRFYYPVLRLRGSRK